MAPPLCRCIQHHTGLLRRPLPLGGRWAGSWPRNLASTPLQWRRLPQAVGRRGGSSAGASCAQRAGAGEQWSAAGGGGGGDRLEWQRADVHVVLVQPQIPQNAGNVARTCAATAVALHLVGPLGFDVDSKKLKRAGLDYWPHVVVRVHDDWAAFRSFFDAQPGPRRLVAFSKFATQHYAAPGLYRPGDWLLFGAETSGLPPEAHEAARSGGAAVKIPIIDCHVRSLNLSVSVGIGLYEAIRQLDNPAPGEQLPPLPPAAAAEAAPAAAPPVGTAGP